MKKKLAALGMSSIVFGVTFLPASPAQAGHCNTTFHNYQEYLACAWEHVAQCVSDLIREGRCGNVNWE